MVEFETLDEQYASDTGTSKFPSKVADAILHFPDPV